MPRIWPGYFAVWAAVLLHLTWCVLLFLPSTQAGLSTPVRQVVVLAGGNWYAGMLFLLVAGAAVVGLLQKSSAAIKIFFLLPQQLVLGVSAAGAIIAMAESHYADGLTRAGTFIVADQLAIVLTWFFHTLAIMFLFLIHTERITLGGRFLRTNGVKSNAPSG